MRAAAQHAVGSGRHAHIQENDGEWSIGGDGVPNRGHGRLGAVAENGCECNVAARRFLGRLLGGSHQEQPFAQIAEHRRFAADVRFQQDLAVGVAYVGLVIGDENPDC